MRQTAAFRQLYRANWSEFLGDRRALFLTVAFPVILIVLFGLVFGSPDRQTAAIGLVLEDSSDPLAESLAQAFEALPKQGDRNHPLSGLTFKRGAADALRDELKRGRLDALLVLPAKLGENVAAGRPSELSIVADPGRQTLIPFLQGVTGAVLRETEAQVAGRTPLLGVKTQGLQARELRTIDFLLPGILALAILQIGLFATPQGLIAMRVSGVLKRLGATPLPRSTLLLSYIAMRLTVALIQTAVIVALGKWVFDVAMLGSWVAFAGWVLLGTLAFIALGFFTAAVARSEESGTAIANFLNLPMILLAGIFFPLENLPASLQWLVNALPLPYLADALRQVMVDAPPAHDFATSAGVLGAWAAGASLLAVRFFQWEQR